MHNATVLSITLTGVDKCGNMCIISSMNKNTYAPSAKWTAEVTARPWAKPWDQFNYDGWAGETAAEAVFESLLQSGLDEGEASDRLAACTIVVI